MDKGAGQPDAGIVDGQHGRYPLHREGARTGWARCSRRCLADCRNAGYREDRTLTRGPWTRGQFRVIPDGFRACRTCELHRTAACSLCSRSMTDPSHRPRAGCFPGASPIGGLEHARAVSARTIWSNVLPVCCGSRLLREHRSHAKSRRSATASATARTGMPTHTSKSDSCSRPPACSSRPPACSSRPSDWPKHGASDSAPEILHSPFGTRIKNTVVSWPEASTSEPLPTSSNATRPASFMTSPQWLGAMNSAAAAASSRAQTLWVSSVPAMLSHTENIRPPSVGIAIRASWTLALASSPPNTRSPSENPVPAPHKALKYAIS